MIRYRDYTHELYRRLPEGREGDFSIEKGNHLAGITIRTYFPGGFHYWDELARDYPYVKLTEKGTGIWMSDSPGEQEALQIPTIVAHGDVLIIGLGIGLFPTMLKNRNRDIKSITIVEKNVDVIKLVYKHIATSKMSIVHDEGQSYFLNTYRKFDFIYIDIWDNVIAPIKGMDEWLEIAKYCLTPNGEARCWLQELYNRVRAKLPKEPVNMSGNVGLLDPCLVCGKILRFDYAGLCMDCADMLGVSEMFIGV